MMINPLNRAIAHFGGRVAFAGALGVTPQAVFLWVKNGRVSVERALAIEAATDGKVTRHDLRPDIFSPPPQDFLDQDREGEAA